MDKWHVLLKFSVYLFGYVENGAKNIPWINAVSDLKAIKDAE